MLRNQVDQQKILTKTYFYHPLLDYKNIFLSPPARLQKHISITPCSTKTYFYHQLLDKNIFLSPPTRQKHISITTYSTTFYHHLLDENIFLSPPTRLLFTASATKSILNYFVLNIASKRGILTLSCS